MCRGGAASIASIFCPWSGAQDFEVSPAESSPTMPSRDVGLEAMKHQLSQAMQQANEEQRRPITESEESREPNPWLCRMGWVEHLAGNYRK